MSAALYARISLDREGEALGVTRQQEDARALAAKLGLTITEEYVDNDISASTRSTKARPGYAAMIAAVEDGRIRHIVAYSNSRLTRRPRELESLVELHQRTGVQLHTVVSGNYDLSTADGRLQARLLGSIDAAEAERTSERISRAARQAAEAGRWHGGPRPFGYEADGVTVREVEATALRDGFAAVLTGESLASIARAWNEAGLRTGRSGKPWATPSVREALCNGRYAGLRMRLGEVAAEAQWPAVVDRETWEAVRTILRDPARSHGPKGARRLLTGLAVCGVCGGTVFASGGNQAKPVYRCRTMGHVARQAEPIEEWVTAAVLGRLGAPDAEGLFGPRAKSPEVEVLREDAQALRARLAELADLFADGAVTAEQLRAGTARLRDRLDEVERAIADGMVVSPLARFSGRDPAVVWAGLDVDVQRSVIGWLAEVRILSTGRGARRFDPETVQVRWV